MLKPLFTAFFNWLFYSNIYIAICAYCIFEVTKNGLKPYVQISETYGWILFFATLSLYAFHRYIGIQKLSQNISTGRYKIITEFRSHIVIYGIVSGLIAAAGLLYSFPLKFIFYLIPAAIVSVLYVAPIFPGQKRLRDFPYIKIFLIAVIWSWLTAFLPLMEGTSDQTFIGLHSIERALFFFAITLPFDIRDLEVDKIEATRTIPRSIGETITKGLALLALVLGIVIIWWLSNTYALDNTYLYASVLTYALSALLILLAKKEYPDWYYTGLLDGVMIVYLVLLLCL